MSSKSNIAILILAAGSSSRMGQSKQLLLWKNTTLIGDAIQTALSISNEVFVVLGANAELIQPEVKPYPVKIILNNHWQNGLGSSIAYGVTYLQSLGNNFDGVLVMLADQPLIDREHLKALIDNFTTKNPIVTTSYTENKEGVPAIFSKMCFEKLSQLNTDFGAKQLIKTSNTITVKAYHKIIDIDTIEDYNKLISQNKHL